MNEIKEKDCIVCKNSFKYNTKIHTRGIPIGFRGRNAVTCSKKCSKIYIRIFNYAFHKFLNNKKEVKK